MMQKIYVYISEVSDNKTVPLPQYIDTEKITNPRVLAEKRSAYSLLYAAAKKEYGIDLDPLDITKTENGKPLHPSLCFSVSNSKGICAVALSENEVGLDIEEEISGERAVRIRKSILHPNEAPDTDITALWTKKEAVFKLLGGKVFVGPEIDTTAYYTEAKELVFGERRFKLCVASEIKSDGSIKLM